MEQDTTRPPDRPGPLRAVASGLRQLPGAERVGKAAEGALDAIGAVSPRGRRMAVYAGAGVLGVAGVVEWPVALTGAAVAWLTRPRPARGRTAEPLPGAPARADGPRETADQEPPVEPTGPGDRLALSRRREGRTERPVREQPAKVGDTATASALKQVAEAARNHGPHTERDTTAEQPRDARHSG